MLAYPFIHALVSAADQYQSIKSRQLPCHILRKQDPARGKQYDGFGRASRDPHLPGAYRQRFGAFKNRLRLEQHTLTTAKRPVIHRAVPVMGESPQVMHPDVNNSGFSRPPHNAMLQRPAKKVRENRDDLELHRDLSASWLVLLFALGLPLFFLCRQRRIKLQHALRQNHFNALGCYIDPFEVLGRIGNKDFSLPLLDHQQRRLARSELHLAHRANLGGCRSQAHHQAASQIAHVFRAGFELPSFTARYLHLIVGQRLGFVDGIDAAKLEDHVAFVQPVLFQFELSPLPVLAQQKEAPLFGKALRKIGVKFGGNFAAPSLRFEDARNRDKLFADTRYSRISSVNRFCSFMPAAPRMVRMERAVRPCLPITLPRSLGATRSSSTALSPSCWTTLTAT